MTIGSYDTLLATPAPLGAGIPCGDPARDWRLVVEMLLWPDDVARWDIGLWDTALWAEPRWVDVTPYFEGASWRRGTITPFGRADVGVGTIRLANHDGRWSPGLTTSSGFTPLAWDPTVDQKGTGTPIRAQCRRQSDGATVPQLFGLVEDWAEGSDGVGAVRWVDITFVEPLTGLAKIDNNAVDPIGAKFAPERIGQLLLLSSWEYGYGIDVIGGDGMQPSFGLQPTNLAANRLAEIYRTVDSTTSLRFAGHRSGWAVLNYQPDITPSPQYGNNPTPGSDWWQRRAAGTFYDKVIFHPTGVLPTNIPVSLQRPHVALTYDADTLNIRRDERSLVTEARVSRSGGNETLVERPTEIARYGRRTYSRNDLMCVDDFNVVTAASVILSRRSRASATVRIEGLRIDSRPENLPALWVIDIGDQAHVVSVDRTQASWVSISALEHQVAVRDEHGLDWSVDVAVDCFTGPAYGTGGPG